MNTREKAELHMTVMGHWFGGSQPPLSIQGAMVKYGVNEYWNAVTELETIMNGKNKCSTLN